MWVKTQTFILLTYYSLAGMGDKLWSLDNLSALKNFAFVAMNNVIVTRDILINVTNFQVTRIFIVIVPIMEYVHTFLYDTKGSQKFDFKVDPKINASELVALVSKQLKVKDGIISLVLSIPLTN